MNTGRRLLRWASGIMLVPSPYFAGVVSGALIILAARRGKRSGTVRDRENAPA